MELPVLALPPIRYVQVQTHSRCNANCLFCPYVESEHAAAPGTMTDWMWNRVLDCLKPFPIAKFCPYLMQEPLIDRTIFAKIEDVYRLFPDVTVEVSTNGEALTEKVISSLVSIFSGRRHALWLSHHGINKSTLEHVMQISYDKAIKGVVGLLKAADGKLNILIRGAGERRDGKMKFFSKQQYLDYWRDLFSSHKINTANVSIDAFTFHDRAGTLFRNERDACSVNCGTVREIGPNHPFHCCRVDEWVHIMWDGRIRLCCMDYHGEVQLPSLKNMTLVEYFGSFTYRELAGKVTGSIESEPDFICKRCTSPGG